MSQTRIRPGRCRDFDGCTRHDHGNCCHCGVRFSKAWPAWSFDGDLWVCESCYIAVRDAVDEALDSREG